MIKRSEFYALFITVIVLMTATVSFAVSYQPQIIQPTKPYSAELLQSCDPNTLYTVVNVTGKGIVSRISACPSSASAANSKVYFQITIDGGAPLSLTTGGNNSYSAMIAQSEVSGAAYNYNYFCNLNFKTSLKIEFKQTDSSSRTYFLTTNYTLE